MIMARFANLDELPDGELRALLDLLDRLHTEVAEAHPASAGFLHACWTELSTERQRRWDALVARSRELERSSWRAPDQVPWVRRSPATRSA
jgi:hypothetical protein